MTVKSKKPKKKTPTKRRSTKALQSNIGKGPNININIDQSKKTTKKAGIQQQAQPRQQIISTFTPVHAPPPPIYNFPLPTNLNPFEAATKATQKTNIQEQNELEKPKPKTKQTSEGFAQTDDIPEATFVEPVQFVESFPVRDEIPLVKPIRIKPPKADASTQIMETKPHKERYNRSIQTDNPITKAISTNTEGPRQRTPLEQPIDSNSLVVFSPKIKTNRQSNVMTMQDLNNENETKPVRNLIPFIGIGNRLNMDDVINRLSREEIRKKRLKSLETPLLLEEDKKVIMKPNQSEEINEPVEEKVINKTNEIELLKNEEERKAKEAKVKQEKEALKQKEKERQLEIDRFISSLPSDQLTMKTSRGQSYIDYVKSKYANSMAAGNSYMPFEDFYKAVVDEDKRYAEENQEAREGYRTPQQIEEDKKAAEQLSFLKKKTVIELKAIANERGFPKESYSKLNKQPLIEFLMSNKSEKEMKKNKKKVK